MDAREEFTSWLQQLLALAEGPGAEGKASITRAEAIAAAVAASEQPEKAKAALLFSASSLILNCAMSRSVPATAMLMRLKWTSAA